MNWAPTLPEGGYPSTVQDFVTARKGFYPPVWTTATRPTALEKVLFGFNTDIQAFEFWSGTAWLPVSTSGGGYLPLSGGTMAMTNSIVAYPVANTNPTIPTYACFVAQTETTHDNTIGEAAAVFGMYVTTGQPNGQKPAVYVGAVQAPTGGTTWSFNTDVVRNGIPSNVAGGPGNVGSSQPGPPGAIPIANGTIGYELDFTNWDADFHIGSGAFTVGMYIHNQSLYQSTAGIYFDCHPLNAGQNNYAWDTAVMFVGQYLASANTIFDTTSSSISLHIEGTHATSVYLNDTAQHGLQVSGNHTINDIWITDNAPTVMMVGGTHTSIVDVTAATGVSIAWNGPFSATSIDSTPIGATTPAPGHFTSLSAAGQLTVQPPNLTTTTFNAAEFITSTATGSGTNGPATSQVGLNINHQKQNYLTTSNVGEIDGLYVTVRQGGPGSDVGGVLVDVGNTGSGFSTVLEGVTAQMAPTTGAVQRAIRVQMAAINPGTPLYTGLLVQAQNGTSTQGILISDVPGQGQWTNFIEGWNSGNQNFVVQNTGLVYTLGGMFVGPAGQIQVQGAQPVTSSGAFMTWNVGGDGSTHLVTNKGGGTTGGFIFEDSTSSNVRTWIATISEGGTYFSTQIQVQGTQPVAAPGSYLAYNRGGDGSTYLLTNRGGGATGGFVFEDVNNSNVSTFLATISQGGIYFGFPVTCTDGVTVQGSAGTTTSSAGYFQYNRGGDGTTWIITNPGTGSTGGVKLGSSDGAGVITTMLEVYTTGIWINGAAVHLPSTLVNAANDAAAASAGVVVSQMYRNGSQLMVRVT